MTLELELRESTTENKIVNDYNYHSVNPAQFFDLSPMTNDYLRNDMVNFFAQNAGNTQHTRTTAELRTDIRYAENLDLEEDEVYLRKAVESIYYSHDLQAQGLTMDDILQWDDENKIATVYLFDEVFLFIPENMTENQAISIYNERILNENNAVAPLAANPYNRSTTYFSSPFSIAMHSIGISFNLTTILETTVPTTIEPVILTSRITRNNRIAFGEVGYTSSGSSLILYEMENDADKRNMILSLLQELTRDTLEITTKWNWLRFSTTYTVNYTIIEGDTLNVGTELIRRVIDSDHNIEIGVTRDRDRYRVSNSLDAMNPGSGTGGRIRINEIGEYTIVADLDENWEWDLTWVGIVSRVEQIPAHIVLGHELIHALRASEGYWRPDIQIAINSFMLPPPYGVVIEPTFKLEEIETIGIAHRGAKSGDTILPSWQITENALRREHNLPSRITHWGGYNDDFTTWEN
jgi:hypothetical protein